ncbi:MAG: efflux RND transporter permease subunit [Oscillospiraceae bacterium]|nr:efflux RND transporter permease subunit [Oscillospiraceae bacterium]
MSKFSVKKPFTVFVAVIAVLVLGVVAYLKMTPDLLPNMNFPYVIIVTAYPGASPEKVETEITKPMEQSMATLEDIKEVSSTSSENYSMVMLEFEESVNMDTVGVDIQQNIATLSSSWDDMVQTPYVMKINPSMLPVMVAAVSMEGKDTMELTQLLDEELLNKLEGVAGVARISTSGTVVQQLHVVLDQKRIDEVNEKLGGTINDKMDEALEELTDAKEELTAAQKQMDKAQKELDKGKDALTQQTTAGAAEIDKQLFQLQDAKKQLDTTLSVLKAVNSGIDALEEQEKTTREELEQLKKLQQRLQALELRQGEMDEKIAAIEASGKPQDEIQRELEALRATEEYVTLAADQGVLDAELAARNVNRQTLAARITLMETTMTQLEQRREELLKTLAGQGVDLKELDSQLAQLEESQKQLAGGISQLEEAKKTLSQKQMEGLLELSDAATQLAVNGSTVTAALTQVEGGITTLEDTRKQTLEQADLKKILTMELVSQILTAQNFAMPAGTVEQDGVSYMVSVGKEITQKDQLEELLLFDMGMEGVEPVYLKDVAAVMVTDNRDETYAKLDGIDSIVLNFEKQSTYATAETTENLLDRFEKLEESYPGLRFVPLMNQGDYIYLIVESILSSLLLGAVFAVLVLFLFLKDLRPTFITLCSIPISVIFAIVLMYFSGVTINMISLSGLAVSVGMLVDNSVVVIENIYRLRDKGATAMQAAVTGAKQVAGAITASTLTTVCVFLPIVFVEGITKQLFTDLALTMTYSLLASLIVALTLVPAMAAGMLKKEKKFKSPLMDRFLAGYEKAVVWSLKHKAIVLSVSAALLVVSCLLSLAKGFIFMPAMDMPNVNVTVSMPEDATMEEAVALADQVLEKIAAVEGIETAGAMMGGGLSLMGGSAESKDLTVYLILSDEKASGAAVGKRIEELCQGMDCEVTATSAMMDMSMLSGSGISLELYCNDMQKLQAAAEKAGQALEGLSGVAEVDNGLQDLSPALHVDVDRNKAMSQGVTVAQIYMELAAALQNTSTVTTLELSGTSTELIVEKPEGAVLTADTLKDHTFEVTTQTGEKKTFALHEVATVEETTSLSSISRLSQRRYLTVSATLTEGENVTLVTRQAEKVMAGVELGEGVTYAFTGENETIMEAVEQLILMLLLGILLVYLVMVAQFQSLKSPFIVMFTIPLAFTGGFAALLICGLEVSVISLIGFIMLTGIIVNNGIVLVDYINQLRQEGVDRRAAIVEAGKTRMRPILMTTLTTVIGLGQMALDQNVGTSLIRPVAVVCIGGLMYATLMTLLVVPCIYDMMNKKELRVVADADMVIEE